VSAGARGTQVLLPPAALLELLEGRGAYADLV
jgi:hypothetical protein